MVAPVPPSPVTGNAPLDGWFTLLHKKLLGAAADVSTVSTDLASLSGSLSSVATSGAYADLSGTPTIATGTWTPTLNNTTNVAASTAYACNYLRVNDRVVCSGVVNVDPTAAAVCVLGISLPVASALTTAYQLRGTAIAPSDAGYQAVGGVITADAANDRATLSWYALDGTAKDMTFTFMYDIL